MLRPGLRWKIFSAALLPVDFLPEKCKSFLTFLAAGVIMNKKIKDTAFLPVNGRKEFLLPVKREKNVTIMLTAAGGPGSQRSRRFFYCRIPGLSAVE